MEFRGKETNELLDVSAGKLQEPYRLDYALLFQHGGILNTTRIDLNLTGEEEGQIRVLYVNVFNFIFWYNTANKTNSRLLLIKLKMLKSLAPVLLQCHGGCGEMPQDNSNDERKKVSN